MVKRNGPPAVGQLGLFASGDRAAGSPASADQEPVDAQLEELAAAIPEHVRFGTSSWTFDGWTGIVYRHRYATQRALARDSLEEYSRYPLFGTVGIDSTYYRPATAETLRHYAAQLPAGFRCVMKVHSEITTFVWPDHERAGKRRGEENPGFLDAARFRDTVHAAVEASGFGEHLAAYVLELPPTHGRLGPAQLVDELDRFFAEAPVARYAVELREPQLMTDAYLRVVAAAGASHVFNFHSRMPGLSRQLATVQHGLGRLPGNQVIVRLLQPPRTNYAALKQRYAPFHRLVAPDEALRRDVLELVSVAAAQGSSLFVIVNNKAEGSAPLTIRAIVELLRDRVSGDGIPD